MEATERVELAAALKDAGLQLGDRIKLRLWIGTAVTADATGRIKSEAENFSLRMRLQASDEGEKKTSGLSAECVCL